MATRHGIGPMAATFGKVEEFDSKKEEWPQYVERLQHFFVANDIVDAEKDSGDPVNRY